MVSALDSGLWAQKSGFKTWVGWVNVLCSLAKHFTLTMPSSLRSRNLVAANYQGSMIKCRGGGVTFQWASLSCRGR